MFIIALLSLKDWIIIGNGFQSMELTLWK